MFDPILRRWIDPPLDRAAQWCAQRGAHANTVTLLGLAIGLSAVPLLAFDQYGLALIVILLNRLIDGLDGALARRNGLNPFGGYLDIGCDMAFYGAVPLGFALARPENAVWAALLLASFMCTAASFLGRAILAVQRREADDATARIGTHVAHLLASCASWSGPMLTWFRPARARLSGPCQSCQWTAGRRPPTLSAPPKQGDKEGTGCLSIR